MKHIKLVFFQISGGICVEKAFFEINCGLLFYDGLKAITFSHPCNYPINLRCMVTWGSLILAGMLQLFLKLLVIDLISVCGCVVYFTTVIEDTDK